MPGEGFSGRACRSPVALDDQQKPRRSTRAPSRAVPVKPAAHFRMLRGCFAELAFGGHHSFDSRYLAHSGHPSASDRACLMSGFEVQPT